MWDRFEQAGLQVAGIVVDEPSKNLAMVEKLLLPFPILSDRGNQVARRFGVVFTLPDYLREIYRAFPLDLAQYNEAEPWTLPMPGRFVIDRACRIRASEVDGAAEDWAVISASPRWQSQPGIRLPRR